MNLSTPSTSSDPSFSMSTPQRPLSTPQRPGSSQQDRTGRRNAISLERPGPSSASSSSTSMRRRSATLHDRPGPSSAGASASETRNQGSADSSFALEEEMGLNANGGSTSNSSTANAQGNIYMYKTSSGHIRKPDVNLNLVTFSYV